MRLHSASVILLLVSISFLSAHVDVEMLARKIHSLGDSLYHTMLNVPEGHGTKFIREVKEFNKLLKQMVEAVNADKNRTKTVLDGLVTVGLPKFLDTRFNDSEKKMILEKFNWTLDDLEVLYADRINAYTYWTDLLLLKNDNYQYDV